MNTEDFKASARTSIHTLRHKVGGMAKERSKVNEVTGTLQANAGSTRACNVLAATDSTEEGGHGTASICHGRTAGSLA